MWKIVASTADEKEEEAKKRIPERYHQFIPTVFSKDSFDELPQRKKWDHAIDLKPGAQPTNCKVYPLTQEEQKELDMFLKENLESG